MNVIRHDYIFVNRHTGNGVSGFDIFLHNLSGFRKTNKRGVEGAAPYNAAQYASFIFNANCKEIGAGGAVVKIRQTI